MPSIRHKPLIGGLIAALLIACNPKDQSAATLTSAGNSVGDFKGYYAINALVRQRLVDPAAADRFELSRYLGEYSSGSQEGGLETLLGVFKGQGAANRFRNGQPNPMNMLLWNLALSQLAEGMSQACDADQPPPGTFADFLAKGPHVASLKPLCAWPGPAAKKPELLDALWHAVMGYEAPESELNAWRDAFLSPDSPVAESNGHEAVRSMLKAIFLNPNFLLET